MKNAIGPIISRRSTSWISRLLRRSAAPRLTSAEGCREAYRHVGIDPFPDPRNTPTPATTARRFKETKP